MKVRFPNESYYDNAPSFEWEDFKVERVFEDVVFGWWLDTYVEISRDDYDKKNQNDLEDKKRWLEGDGPQTD